MDHEAHWSLAKWLLSYPKTTLYQQVKALAGKNCRYHAQFGAIHGRYIARTKEEQTEKWPTSTNDSHNTQFFIGRFIK